MSKRKASKTETKISNGKQPTVDADGDISLDDDNDSDFSNLDIDFELFNFRELDYHGVKSLLAQLFDVDAHLVDLSGLTDRLITEPAPGSTVKVDGEGEDAFGFVSVLDLREEKGFVDDIVRWLRGRVGLDEGLKGVRDVLGTQEAVKRKVGLVLSERLINCPAEVVPPMYEMLVREIGESIEAGEGYDFDYYLVLSRTYIEVASAVDEADERPKKKSKKGGKTEQEHGTMWFHVEDEVLQRFANASGGFEYVTPRDTGHSDSKRAFQEMGISPQAHVMLIEKGRFEEAIKAMKEYLPAG